MPSRGDGMATPKKENPHVTGSAKDLYDSIERDEPGWMAKRDAEIAEIKARRRTGEKVARGLTPTELMKAQAFPVPTTLKGKKRGPKPGPRPPMKRPHGKATAAARNALAQRLRELREKRGWSQVELAERAGMQGPGIARIESGRAVPQLEMLNRLAKALGAEVRIEIVERER
jgi:ribosome-binding protein aMBF1 (putative translation factor)